MLPIHTILFPTDFSESSTQALHVAQALARDYDARLIALHAVPLPTVVYSDGVIPPDLGIHDEAARAELDRLDLPAGSERRFVEGDPIDVILNTARDAHVDLIVMGTHGRTGLSRLLMGSVAEHVLRKAPCPVLTVRMPFPEAASQTRPQESALHATTA